MELTADHIAAVKRAAAASAANSTMRILETVCIQNGPAGFRVTGNDMTVQVEVSAEALEESFGFCVDADRINKVFAVAKSARMTVGDGKITVHAGRSRFTVPTLPEQDYPFLPAPRGEPQPCPPGLAAALAEIGKTASTSDTSRPYLMGVCIDGEHVVATDSHRISVRALGGHASSREVIIPVGALRAIDGEFETIQIGEGGARFSRPGLIVTTKLVDGRYPAWQRVVPDPRGRSVARFHADAAAEAVSQTLVAANRKVLSGHVEINAEKVVLRTTDEDGAEAVSEFAAEFDGKLFKTAFNLVYLKDAFQAFKGKTVELHLASEREGVLITCDDDPALRHVVMPMKL